MKKAIAVFQRHGSQWNPAVTVREQPYWDEHARFVDELFDAGKIVLAGPFADGSGALVIMAVESVETARAIFREDPWAQRDIQVAADVKEWTIFLDAKNRVES